MKKTLVRYRNSAFGKSVIRNQKYLPILFFMGGFIFDTMTLGRIDRLYDTVVLCSHITLLSVTLYLFNLAGDGKWKNTFIGQYSDYFPLVIQFIHPGMEYHEDNGSELHTMCTSDMGRIRAAIERLIAE